MGLFDGSEDVRIEREYTPEQLAIMLEQADDLKAMTKMKGWEVLVGVVGQKIDNLRDMIEHSGARMSDSETKHTLGRLGMAREILDLPRVMNETAVNVSREMDKGRSATEEVK